MLHVTSGKRGWCKSFTLVHHSMAYLWMLSGYYSLYCSQRIKCHSQYVLVFMSLPSTLQFLGSIFFFFCHPCLFSTISLSAPSLVSSITVNTPAELHASKGDTVTLSCTFTSTSMPTSKMTVDWSYRPQTGGPPQTVSIHPWELLWEQGCINSSSW